MSSLLNCSWTFPLYNSFPVQPQNRILRPQCNTHLGCGCPLILNPELIFMYLCREFSFFSLVNLLVMPVFVVVSHSHMLYLTSTGAGIYVNAGDDSVSTGALPNNGIVFPMSFWVNRDRRWGYHRSGWECPPH